MKRKLALCAGLFALLPTRAAMANDSQAAIGLGGLALTRSDAVSMDSEDLYISKNEIRVRYRFTNHSSRDIETLVSFPVPSLPHGIEGDYHDTAMPEYEKLEFRSTIDGKPLELHHVQRAEVAGRDVTQRLTALGWPLRWFEDVDDPVAFVARLTPAQKAAYRREGLLKPSPYDRNMLMPAWSLVTHVTRTQTFPAGKTVEVTHRYVPYAGGSVGGALDKDARGRDYNLWRVRKFCIDRSFNAAFDRQRSAIPNKEYGEAPYGEIWLSYILKTGANWRGPIRDFRLVVDKGSPDNLVSFCMNGVRKISPTQFEVRKSNYTPTRDLDVMIVEFSKP